MNLWTQETMDLCSLPTNTHTNTSLPLEMGLVYQCNLTERERYLLDTLGYRLTRVCVHPHTCSHRLRDIHIYTRYNAVGSPRCVHRHACTLRLAHSPTLPATRPQKRRNAHAPLFPCSHAHTPSRGGGGAGGPQDPPALLLGLCGHPSVLVKLLLPVSGTSMGPRFYGKFFL